MAHRVDWFELAYRPDPARLGSVLADWRGRLDAAAAREHGPVAGQRQKPARARVAVQVAGMSFELKRGNSPFAFTLSQGGSRRLRAEIEASGGWSLLFSFDGTYFLNGGTHHGAVRYARAVAAELGWTPERDSESGPSERARRCDLSADLAGVSFTRDDQDAFIKPRRGRIESGTPGDGERPPTTERQTRPRELSGVYVCKGAAIHLCAYDKRLQADPEKIRAEEERWIRGGWDGSSPVWRCEFRLRSEALGELGRDDRGLGYRDDVDRLLQELDAIWAYLTGRWVRLVVPGSAARLKRCEIDPRWAALQAVKWGAEHLAPAPRRRIRLGADVLQTTGTVLSFLAGGQALGALVFDGYELEPETASMFVDRCSDAECMRLLYQYTDRQARDFGHGWGEALVERMVLRKGDPVERARREKRPVEEVASEMVAEAGRQALHYVINRHGAALARFSDGAEFSRAGKAAA